MSINTAEYVRARSLIAAMADAATDLEVAFDYEQALVQLDKLCGLPRTPVAPVAERDLEGAATELARLFDGFDGHVDAFELALCRAMVTSTVQRDSLR